MYLKQLEVFLAVATQKSFVRAAQQLYLSQPAVSQQIQKLEQELGFALLVRDHHSVQLTPAGQRFLAGAQEICALYRRTVADCLAIDCARVPLKIGYIGQGNLYALPAIAAAYRRRFPDMLLETVRLAPKSAMDQLRQERISFVLTPQELVTEKDLFCFSPLYTDKHYCVMPLAHPLAGHSQLTPAQLAGAVLLVPGKDFCPPHMQQLLAALEQLVPPPQLIPAGNIDNAVLHLLSLQAIAIMPGYTCPSHPGLVCVPLADGVGIPYGLACRQKLSPAEKDFLAVARAEYANT